MEQSPAPERGGRPGGGGGQQGNIAEKEVELEKNMEIMMDRFKRLFDANEVDKGGSFYLQSKILRARQRIEREAAKELERLEGEKEKEELAKGWR